MTLHEIRETIEVPTVELDANGFGIVQKKINLTSRKRHIINHLDIFQDAIPYPDGAPILYIEWFVSPYPIIYGNNDLTQTLPNRGAMAGNDTVLMKAMCSNYQPDQFFNIETFPNQFLGAAPTFQFFSPHLYITGFIHGEAGAIVSNLAFSFYVATDDKKAGLVPYGLGLIRERSVAQGLNLVQQGRTIPPARNVGQIFPMWKYGGARPERMLRGDALADFFLPYASNDSEKMVNTANIRTYVKAARTMQGFDQAFGAFDAAKGQIPDWLRLHLNRGLVAGPIRAQQPPRKLADNGNTLMF
ncbi:unnamed protein product [marine sediment metagenome]|uniref:Uncharacterized protein n=1 Tax=marine sediment metagenome TaxID=412755 RepID=X1AF67_9ZZZZ